MTPLPRHEMAGHVSQVPPQKHMKSIRTQPHIRHQPSLLPSSASCNSPVAPTGLPGPSRAYCCDRSNDFQETCRTHPSPRPLQGTSLRQVNCRNSSRCAEKSRKYNALRTCSYIIHFTPVSKKQSRKHNAMESHGMQCNTMQWKATQCEAVK